MKKEIALLTSIYFLVILAMLPLRNQAFLDDFAYINTVRNFVNTKNLVISEWSTPSLIFPTFWGGFFSLILGFSPKVLHLSAIILVYFGVVAFYKLLRELRVQNSTALVFSLMFIATPKVLRYTFSFMSDMQYVSLVLVTLYLGVIAIKRNSSFYFFLASVFSMLAYLTRQLGIALIIALFFAYVLKSLTEKKCSLKTLSLIVLPAVLVYYFYNLWLNSNGHMTIGQRVFYKEHLDYLKLYLYPQGLHRLRPTSEIYDDVVYKVFYYLVMTLGLISPILLFFKYPARLSQIKKTAGKPLLIGALFLIFGYWILFRRIKDPNFSELVIFQSPQILFSSVHSSYNLLIDKIWNIILFISFPIWSYVVGLGFMKIQGSISVRRKSVMKKFLLASLLIIAFVGLRGLFMGVSLFGGVFLKESYFIYFWMVFFGLAAIYVSLYAYNCKLKDLQHAPIALFLICFVLFQTLVTALGHHTWEEYVLPYIPSFLVLIAWLLSSLGWEVSLPRAAVVVSFLMFFSLQEAKLGYDESGVKWEEAEKIVRSGDVDARQVGIINWAWIPYFYQEESYLKRLAEVGGDKRQLVQIHTWWEDPEYDYRRERLSFPLGACKHDYPDLLFKKELQASSIFARTTYCMVLIK